jgi:hypothetical protein
VIFSEVGGFFPVSLGGYLSAPGRRRYHETGPGGVRVPFFAHLLLYSNGFSSVLAQHSAVNPLHHTYSTHTDVYMSRPTPLESTVRFYSNGTPRSSWPTKSVPTKPARTKTSLVPPALPSPTPRHLNPTELSYQTRLGLKEGSLHPSLRTADPTCSSSSKAVVPYSPRLGPYLANLAPQTL